MPEITTFLTYESQAEEAVRHYLSIFENGKVVSTLKLPHGAVLSVTFELLGKTFIAMNGGPSFKFSQAFSLFITCDTQAEIDRYWAKLTADGGKEVKCGWLVDKFGVSWQIIPKVLGEMMQDKDASKAGRAMKALMTMTKLDIAALKQAYDGG